MVRFILYALCLVAVVTIISFILGAVVAMAMTWECDSDSECQDMCYRSCYQCFEPVGEEMDACWRKCEDLYGEVELEENDYDKSD